MKGKMAIVEANIDDMNPELYAVVMERLFEAGAVDAYLTPILMKKGRPAHILTALTPPEYLDQVTRVFFTESSSIGLRIHRVEKRFLPREIVQVATPWGTVRAKACYLKGELVNLAPEFEDCRQLSQQAGVPIKQIYQQMGQPE